MNGKGEESVGAKEGVREGGDRMYSLVMVNDHGAGNQETSDQGATGHGNTMGITMATIRIRRRECETEHVSGNARDIEREIVCVACVRESTTGRLYL